jgi:hypothetical protein
MVTKVDKPITGLDLLRVPFPAHQISKLPKPTKAQTDAVKANFKEGVRCEICGGWHHPKVVHLDYVGHAALTDRLLEADLQWNWEPMALTECGAPATDENGGLWIKLTVSGVTRLGYGHPDGKKGGDAIKEAIGDALRNAAMRFGAALDLWHKGDLHADEAQPESPRQDDPRFITEEQEAEIASLITQAGANKPAYLEYLGIGALSELPAAHFDNAKRAIMAKIKKAKEAA